MATLAATDDQNLFADGETVPEIDIEQKIDCPLYTPSRFTPGMVRSRLRWAPTSDQHGIEIPSQIGYCEIGSGAGPVQFPK